MLPNYKSHALRLKWYQWEVVYVLCLYESNKSKPDKCFNFKSLVLLLYICSQLLKYWSIISLEFVLVFRKVIRFRSSAKVLICISFKLLLFLLFFFSFLFFPFPLPPLNENHCTWAIQKFYPNVYIFRKTTTGNK